MTWSESVGFESSPRQRESLGFTAANVWNLEGSTICFYCCKSLSSLRLNLPSSGPIRACEPEEHNRAKQLTCKVNHYMVPLKNAGLLAFPHWILLIILKARLEAWCFGTARGYFCCLMYFGFTAHASISSRGQRVQVIERTRLGATLQVTQNSSEAMHIFFRDQCLENVNIYFTVVLKPVC